MKIRFHVVCLSLLLCLQGCAQKASQPRSSLTPVPHGEPALLLFARLSNDLGKSLSSIIKEFGDPMGALGPYQYQPAGPGYDSIVYYSKMSGVPCTFVRMRGDTNSSEPYDVVAIFEKGNDRKLRAVRLNCYSNISVDTLLDAFGLPRSTSLGFWGTPDINWIMGMFRVPTEADRRLGMLNVGLCVRMLALNADYQGEQRAFDPQTNQSTVKRVFKTLNVEPSFHKNSIQQVFVGKEMLPTVPKDLPWSIPIEPDEVPANWVTLISNIYFSPPWTPDSRPERSRLIGGWTWLGGQVLTFNKDGSCVTNRGLTGKWRMLRGMDLYQAIWDAKIPVDYITISADGKRIAEHTDDGRDLSGDRVP